MELILWRHAEAADGGPDMARRLTLKGLRQAQDVAGWLRPRLAKHTRIIVSPAQRTRQTPPRPVPHVAGAETLPAHSARDPRLDEKGNFRKDPSERTGKLIVRDKEIHEDDEKPDPKA